MERVGILLAVFLGCFVAAQATAHTEESTFAREFPSLFEGIAPFPFENVFVPIPHDAIFSSWPTQTSDFHLLEDWPAFPNVPRVEVSCNESMLTVLVWKDLGGVMLTAEEVLLGDGCYGTTELPLQLEFSYSLNECGTSRVVSSDFLLRLAFTFLLSAN